MSSDPAPSICTSRLRRSRLAPALLSALLSLAAACATDEGSERADDAVQPSDSAHPAWFVPPEGTARSPSLEEAAAMLCARDTDGVISDDVRRVAGVWAGQTAGHIERDDPQPARAAVQAAAASLVRETSATHLGIAEGKTPGGAHCVALVVARQVLTLNSELPTALPAPEPFPLSFTLPARAKATIFLMRPDGSVERMETEGDSVQTVIDPNGREGRHVLELIVTGADDSPEVALLWPFLAGAGQVPPAPRVLFPDEGHGDIALTRRTEALVHRLRIEQELEPMKGASPLSRLSRARAQELAEEGRLGHRLPDGASAHEALKKTEPGFAVHRLAEVQAQAGTLAEAWGALLDSPAHRYELVYEKASHAGVAVTRGQDGMGRVLITVVILTARRVSSRPPAQLRTELLGKLNLARDLSGRKPLQLAPQLTASAQRHAQAMAQTQTLTDNLDGAPVTQSALDADAGLEVVRVVKAVLDDPLRLAPSSATLDADATTIGIGLVPPGAADQWHVSILIGTPR